MICMKEKVKKGFCVYCGKWFPLDKVFRIPGTLERNI